MERLTNECWRNFDPWEMCGQDHYCKRGCHELGGCTKGCIVPKVYCRLAAYEDTGLEPEEIKKRLCAGGHSCDGEPVPRWISVEDKLPVGSSGKCHCESVVAYTVEGEVCPGWMNGDTWHLLLPRDNAHTKHGRGYVTHWMPMPMGPKEPTGEN